jgi:N-carbamoylputrescine amidase
MMATMKVTVCELRNDADGLEQDWQALVAQVKSQKSDLLVCPRVTPKSSVDKWIAGGRAAAVVSGAFCLSSNLNGPNTESIAFGGAGWVIEPEEGSVWGVTSRSEPFLTVDIDLAEAERAKHTYPRYVSD